MLNSGPRFPFQYLFSVPLWAMVAPVSLVICMDFSVIIPRKKDDVFTKTTWNYLFFTKAVAIAFKLIHVLLGRDEVIGCVIDLYKRIILPPSLEGINPHMIDYMPSEIITL